MESETYSWASPIGLIRFELAAGKLGQLHFCEDAPATTFNDYGRNPAVSRVAEWLAAYFAGCRPGVSDLPLLLQGTPYQMRIWERLCEIPGGEVITYGAIAAQIGSGARAVGGAVGRNPVWLIVPCHRVVAASGNLGGYAGGIWRKRWLLRHEGVQGY